MRKISLLAGFSLLMLLGAAQRAEARGRFVFSMGIGAPAYAPYGYYAPYPGYYPPYPGEYPPYSSYGPYYYPAPAVTIYGGSYYGHQAYRRDYPRYGYYSRYVPAGRAYGHYAPRQNRRR